MLLTIQQNSQNQIQNLSQTNSIKRANTVNFADKIFNSQQTSSSTISGEYVDDEHMTGNAKATSKVLEIISGKEIYLLEVEADFTKVMTLARKQPINAAEFDRELNTFKEKVEKKRSKLGLSGKSNNSPAATVNIMLAKLKNGNSPQDTLSALTAYRSSANSKSPEGKQIIAITTPYINALQTLNNMKTTVIDKNGNSIDKSNELKKAIMEQNICKINSILKEINDTNEKKSTGTKGTSFSETFKIATSA